MIFKVGDLVEGIKGNPGEYGITHKGNGYGKVIATREVCIEDEDEGDICVLWFKKGEENLKLKDDFWVEAKYFKLKQRKWKDVINE